MFTTQRSRQRQAAAGMAILCLLTACGSGDDQSSNTPAPAPAAAAAGASAAAVAGDTASAAAKDSSATPDGEFAQSNLKAINEARAVGRRCGDTNFPAVAPLRWNLRATEAAATESRWMQSNNTWGHVWPDGTAVADRLTRAGYNWQSAGENIAAGFVSLETVMQAWIDSPGHCVNIMRADVDEVGVSLIPGTGSNTYRSYWTMVLAKESAKPKLAANKAE